MYELYQESVLKLLSYKQALGYVICIKQAAFCDVSATEWCAAFENRNSPNNATHYSDPQQEFLNRGSWNMTPQISTTQRSGRDTSQLLSYNMLTGGCRYG